ncbi:1651_t:CDS:1, partial [Cetraspora pellucida]
GESEQNTTKTTKQNTTEQNTNTAEVDDIILDSNIDRFYNTAMVNFRAI